MAKKEKPEKQKKKKSHKLLIALIVVIVICAAFGSGKDNDSKAAETAAVTTETAEEATTEEATVVTTEETTEATTEPETEQTTEATTEPTTEATTETEKATVNVEDVKYLIKAAIKDNFTYCTVEGDETGITINVAGDGIAKAVYFASAAGYDETYDEWVSMKESVVTMSNSIQELMKSCGMENALLMINVLNDENTDNVLLSMINGNVFYDALAK